MNALKGLVPLSGGLLLLVALVGFVAADLGKLHEDLIKLAMKESDNELFSEDMDGYDKHADIFYYEDAKVDQEYERKKYLSTKVTLAGQKPDVSLRAVKPALNPFGVAQRTFKGLGVMMDRWDVKDSGKEGQYFALYHGKGNTFVVNKVRAHLLRTLANAVDHYLPALDRIAEEDKSVYLDKNVMTVLDDIRSTIERVFREVDRNVRRSMADWDDSSATATVLVVSKSHLIVVSVGEGKVIAYDQDFITKNLAPRNSQKFGLKGSREGLIHPYVEFYPRSYPDYQFVIMETPAVADKLDDERASQNVLTTINQHKSEELQEQEIYSSSLLQIMNKLENDISFFERFFLHSDYSLALIGLNTEYEDIH